MKRAKDFLGYDNIILIIPYRNKATLIFTNQIIQEWSESVGINLGYDFVIDITQANRTKVSNILKKIHFRDESHRVTKFLLAIGVIMPSR